VLGPHEVHLWRIDVSDRPDVLRERLTLLSREEIARMEAYHFERHQARFAMRRGALRWILAQYLGADPGRLSFSVSEHGRPQLERSGEREPELRFNLSHSDDLALIGIVRARDLGVDVEHVRPLPDMDDLARMVFSPAERSEYEALAPDEKPRGFFNGWTRKEAWLKARGVGLAGRLAGFDVTLAPARPPRLLRVAGEPDEHRRWRLDACEPMEGYVAAIAVRDEGGRIVRWRV
jgi:4'-phosphopantetheinyl transferase